MCILCIGTHFAFIFLKCVWEWHKEKMQVYIKRECKNHFTFHKTVEVSICELYDVDVCRPPAQKLQKAEMSTNASRFISLPKSTFFLGDSKWFSFSITRWKVNHHLATFLQWAEWIQTYACNPTIIQGTHTLPLAAPYDDCRRRCSIICGMERLMWLLSVSRKSCRFLLKMLSG